MSLKHVQLSDVCTIIAGQSPPSSTYNIDREGLPFFQGKADFGERHPKVRMWCSSPTKTAEAGDILISVRAPVGPTNVAEGDCCIGRGLSAIRCGTKIDRDYLLHFLRGNEARLADRATGSTFKAITQSTLKEVLLPLPPFPEQKRIAAILDKADEIRRKRAETITLADEFLKSTFLDLFGDPVTNPKGWPVRRLGDLLSFLTSGSRGWAKYYSETGAKFLRIQNVGHNRLLEADMAHVDAPASAESRRTAVQPGDVLLSITADLGRTAVVPKGFGSGHINQHLCILRPRTQDVAPCYLSQFLSSTVAIKPEILGYRRRRMR